MADDVLAEFEGAIGGAEADDRAAGSSPWRRRSANDLSYQPNVELLANLLAGPLRSAASTQSGRLAKGFDAWIAYELRRAAFHPAEVWPRNVSPRVSTPELDALAEKVAALTSWITARDATADRKQERLEAKGDPAAVQAAEERLKREQARIERHNDRRQAAYEKKLAQADRDGSEPPEPPRATVVPDRVPIKDSLLPGLRNAVQAVEKAMPATNATNVLGRFYVKQVDVMVSSWDRGPDVLISGKTMFSSFAKNTKNRYEETLGEASNLRDRYPLAAMGYAFLVSDDIFAEAGAYSRLQDLLLRTRKPFGPYDATMLLIATWDSTSGELQLNSPSDYPDPAVSQQQPPVELSASKFFTDLLGTVITNTPVGVHEPVRELRNGAPAPGGTPNADVVPADGSDPEPDL